MSVRIAKHPLIALRDMERRSRQHARGLPLQVEVKKTWSGVAFRLANDHLVAPLAEVREILTYPTMSAVPGAQGWLKGIANVRGNLLPIINLQSYLGRPSGLMGRHSRVLVIRQAGLFAGLVVDEVLGIKHFLEEQYSADPPMDADPAAQPYLEGAYKEGERQWAVFSMHRLAQNPLFLQVAC